MLVLVVAVALLGVILLLSRTRALFRISIQQGKPSVTSGYVPAALLSDFADVVGRVQQGAIVALKEADGARLSLSGDIDAGVAQRLRNVFGMYPAASLRRMPPRARRP